MTKDFTFLEILRKEEIEKVETQKFAAQMENAVNSFGFPKDQVCELLFKDPMTTKNFFDVSLAWIQCLASRMEWQYDGRNEASVKMAKVLLSDVELKDCFNVMSATFAREASVWHRTLQQTFSGLVFCFLDKVEIPDSFIGISKNIDKMREKYGEKWYYMPLV